jgi:aminoglycoside/choline kinase family phosphotransferase
MDDAPENDGITVPFAKIAAFLSQHDLAPPHVLAHDPDAGLMILTDLGGQDVATWLRHHPSHEKELYRCAADVLVKLHRVAPPPDLPALTAQEGASLLDLVGSYYSRADITDLQSEMHKALMEHAPVADRLALRDFHAENLIWRPAHKGTDRVGLLDFQDAFVAPAGYDLVSLIRDARRDVGQALADDIYAYFAEQARLGPDFTTQLACIAIQRNLRILGIFARLALAYGKPHYVDLIPRVWRYIEADLANPALTNLRQAVLDTVPAPTPAFLAGLRP